MLVAKQLPDPMMVRAALNAGDKRRSASTSPGLRADWLALAERWVRTAERVTLANMREQGVRHLNAYCLNDSCRHQALIDVSSYPGDTPVPWFQSKVKCGKCGARGRRIDVRPNWKEKPSMPTDWRGQPAGEK